MYNLIKLKAFLWASLKKYRLLLGYILKYVVIYTFMIKLFSTLDHLEMDYTDQL